MRQIKDYAERVIDNIENVIIGQRPVLEKLLIALLCQGHVLFEDVPGVGKTMLARALAISLGTRSQRLQCTPDLLPNDVTGVSVYSQADGSFNFIPGPIFANVVVVDEINRATPRTQSALLECMAESQVSVDGVTRKLSAPFLVMATQNPIEYEGTFPLPEAQLDRFFMKLRLGYLNEANENLMLQNLSAAHPIDSLTSVVDGLEIPQLAQQVWQVHVDGTVREYIVRLVTATRHHADLILGASPRASLALYRAAQALAAVSGRDHVLPDDVKSLAGDIIAHRCLIDPESALRGVQMDVLINDLLNETPLSLSS